ncbi:MAG: hypothetical protein RIS76_1562 [Verrucomicrobiota bacterium]
MRVEYGGLPGIVNGAFPWSDGWRTPTGDLSIWTKAGTVSEGPHNRPTMYRLLALLLLLPWRVSAQETGPGTALAFTGRGAVVSMPHSEALNPYPFSVTAWMKTTQTDGSAGLINKYLSGAFCGWQVYLVNGRVRAWYFADARNYVWDGSDGLDGGPVADGRWHHLAFTVDDNGGRLFVDGVLADSRRWTGPPTRTSARQGLTLGNYPGVGPSFFRGQMDEVTVWEVALSAADLRAGRNRSLRGDEPGLVAYYRLDEGTGEVAFDAAGHAGRQPGVLTGIPAWVPSSAPILPVDPTNGLPVVVRRMGAPEMEAGMPLTLEAVGVPDAGDYQWTLEGADIDGATNRIFSRVAVGISDAGEYRFSARIGGMLQVSPPLSLQVMGEPAWLTPLVGRVADAGEVTTLGALASGGQPLTYAWFRNGLPVSGAVSGDLPLGPLLFDEAGTYQLVAANSFGSITSAVATLQVVARPLSEGLVLHLPFDGDFDDHSGRGNHGRYATNGTKARPSPTFAVGQIGTAFRYKTLRDGSAFEYATLGYPPDLRFGDEVDFTVSLWVNYLNHEGDLPFLSNKDWDKSHNVGWAISTQRAGNARVNLTGPRQGTDFFSTAAIPSVRNGRWRHLLVSVQRPRPDQSAWISTYLDGRLVNQTAALAQGSVDTEGLPFVYASPQVSRQTRWAVNVGQDGTGVYFDKGGTYAEARVDDLGIWRRALTGLEARAIYEAGLAGMDLSRAVVSPRLAVRSDGDQRVTLVWPGAPRVRLERGAALDSDAWIPVPMSQRTNAVSLPLNDPLAMFRLTEIP